MMIWKKPSNCPGKCYYDYARDDHNGCKLSLPSSITVMKLGHRCYIDPPLDSYKMTWVRGDKRGYIWICGPIRLKLHTGFIIFRLRGSPTSNALLHFFRHSLHSFITEISLQYDLLGDMITEIEWYPLWKDTICYGTDFFSLALWQRKCAKIPPNNFLLIAHLHWLVKSPTLLTKT